MRQVTFYGPALKEALAAAGVDNFADLSRELGCGSSYISNAISRNSMAVAIAKQIMQKYGIDCEQMKKPAEPEKDMQKIGDPEQLQLDLVKTGLTQADIYKAVYAAIIDAFRDMEKEKTEHGKSN